jgi:hypothetical protein
VLKMSSLGVDKARRNELLDAARRAYEAISLPFAVAILFYNGRIDDRYGMSWARKIRLGWRMYRNTRRIQTGTSYKAHLAMAVKLLEIPPDQEGVVVECGCWKGGATANLSLVCDVVGRDLVVYDSFEGLPPPEPGDRYATAQATGFFRGDLEVVEDNVRRYGAIDRCSFRKGWFKDTLPHHQEPIVLSFVDVDYDDSLHDCVRYLWPHLTKQGYMFLDEYTRLDYLALFFSERYWKRYFGRRPPGVMGTGTGIGVGQYFIGPWRQQRWLEAPDSVAYTRKDFDGHWSYYPEDQPEQA